jgi:uncharacterized protein (TIGR03435 family)
MPPRISLFLMSLCFLAMAAACAGQSGSPRFEVASVKPSPQQGLGRFSGGPGSSDPERIIYESTTLENLLEGAYGGLAPYQISGPDWLGAEFYTITAKLPPGATMDQLRQMIINLLADRFGMVVHRITKDFDGYEIVAAKGGPKLTPSVGNSADPPVYRMTRDSNGVTRYTFARTSMTMMTYRLATMMRMKTPVLDHTGLSGRFDFTLDVETTPPEFDDNSVNVSDALQKQLGLKLNRIKVPREVIVIDHIERVPTPN